MSNPNWLPDIVSVNGEWNDICSRLYRIFHKDIASGGITFKRRPVWYDRRVIDQYEEGFWHLITKEDRNSGRLFDPSRAERLPWCGPAISNCNDDAVKMWSYKERKRIKVYLWLESLDYVIIFEKKNMRLGQVFFLLTAFHVGGNSTKKKLNRKYDNRITQ